MATGQGERPVQLATYGRFIANYKKGYYIKMKIKLFISYFVAIKIS